MQFRVFSSEPSELAVLKDKSVIQTIRQTVKAEGFGNS